MLPRSAANALVRFAFSRHFHANLSDEMASLNVASLAKSSKRKRPFRVSVEGNIGSGKSTCLKFFSKFNSIELHPEPIDKWRDVGGHNLFGFLYSDLAKWNFAFQQYVQLTRLQIQTSPPLNDKIEVKMFERSVQNNRHVFVENAKNNKFLEPCEYEILASWFSYMETNLDIDLDLIIYLKSTPEVVWHRMVKRGRNEETMVPLEYLKQIHLSYEDWLNCPQKVNCKIITIDADQDLEDVLSQLENIIPIIFKSSEDVSKVERKLCEEELQ